MNLSKPQRVSAISGAGTLLAGVGGAVATTDWRIGLYGLLVSVLAAVSGALWPSKPAQPYTTTRTGPAFLDPSVPAVKPETHVYLDGQQISGPTEPPQTSG